MAKTEPIYKDPLWLHEQYTATGSIYKMADLAGCHPRTIHTWMIKHGIPMHGMSGIHHTSEAKRKMALSLQNKPGPMTGHHHSEETRRKMSMSRCGAKNPNWKGGITEKIRKFRRSKEYMAWVKAVLDRAGGKCEECGSTQNVEAHHRVSLYLDFSKALDVSNGKALCKKCHSKKDWRIAE